MEYKKKFDVIIIGGSYAGLSAAMALGRSLRTVLIIDSGKPCNRQTPHSHNFITQDGKTPKQITEAAKEQVLSYPTIQLENALAEKAEKTDYGFKITTDKGLTVESKKLLFSTGVTDEMPPLAGFAECWGISVLHCPYCHGYEVRGETIGVLANGDIAFEMCKHIGNWSKNIILFTNGKLALTQDQTAKLLSKGFTIVEKTLAKLAHENGNIHTLYFQDGSSEQLTALFARPSFKQHCTIPLQLGCTLNDQGYIQVDELQRTSIPGVFAAGDNTTQARSVAFAVAAGTKAGISVNKELIDEDFG
ncbi:NAD(P)/FAD-dependent oxidoreductase [Rubrolithibacter danxiaensis]|uniref:NAD(P)/FAD-dependent oxidoreductase n=1 Tax=Rubrolithibacter danxiaensis TaxID=3390805 RepID=UPI003BF92872